MTRSVSGMPPRCGRLLHAEPPLLLSLPCAVPVVPQQPRMRLGGARGRPAGGRGEGGCLTSRGGAGPAAAEQGRPAAGEIVPTEAGGLYTAAVQGPNKDGAKKSVCRPLAETLLYVSTIPRMIGIGIALHAT